MRCDTPPRMEDVNDRDSSDDDAPADMDDIEIVEVYDEVASDFSEEEGAADEVAPLDNAEVSFAAHQGSAFVCAVSGDGRHIVTGGEDDRGCVWQLDTGQLVFECGGHTDSVTCAAFNHDSTLVATADMGGSLRVWAVESHEQQWEFDIGMDLNWIDWHGQANVLLAGTVEGMVWMWQVPGGHCKNLVGPGTSCGAGRFLSDGRRAAVGYDDGSSRAWTWPASSWHRRRPTCDCCTPARGGSLRPLLSTILPATKPQQWKRCASMEPSAPWRLACSLGPHTVVTGCLDGAVRSWDVRTPQEPALCWRAHRHDILDLVLCPDGQRVVSVSDDGICAVHRFASPD
ncbi:hypothetical protein MRX96_036820 [Rhipicephalus microplus]